MSHCFLVPRGLGLFLVIHESGSEGFLSPGWVFPDQLGTILMKVTQARLEEPRRSLAILRLPWRNFPVPTFPCVRSGSPLSSWLPFVVFSDLLISFLYPVLSFLQFLAPGHSGRVPLPSPLTLFFAAPDTRIVSREGIGPFVYSLGSRNPVHRPSHCHSRFFLTLAQPSWYSTPPRSRTATFFPIPVPPPIEPLFML